MLLTLVFSVCIMSSLEINIPDGPQGPSGAIFKVYTVFIKITKIANNVFQYDLLSNSEAGINYPSEHIGAFVAQNWPPGVVNNEDQAYVPWAATQVLMKINKKFYMNAS